MITPAWTTRKSTLIAPARRGDVIERCVDGEVILIDPLTTRTYHLNPTASVVWQACDGRTPTHTIVESLTAEYDVEHDIALNDIEEVLVWLVANELCEDCCEP